VQCRSKEQEVHIFDQIQLNQQDSYQPSEKESFYELNGDINTTFTFPQRHPSRSATCKD